MRAESSADGTHVGRPTREPSAAGVRAGGAERGPLAGRGVRPGAGTGHAQQSMGAAAAAETVGLRLLFWKEWGPLRRGPRCVGFAGVRARAPRPRVRRLLRLRGPEPSAGPSVLPAAQCRAPSGKDAGETLQEERAWLPVSGMSPDGV